MPNCDAGELRVFRSTEEVLAELERRGLGSGIMEILAQRMAERERAKANGGNGTLNGGVNLN